VKELKGNPIAPLSNIGVHMPNPIYSFPSPPSGSFPEEILAGGNLSLFASNPSVAGKLRETSVVLAV
jgi:hypothetical protein